MRIFDIMVKDLLQVLRDKKAALFLLAMPLVFTFVMGLAFSDVAKPPDPRLALGWINQDPGGELSETLAAMLGESDSLRVVELAPEQAATAREDLAPRGELAGKVTGVLIVPPGFSQAALAGEAPQLTLVTNELSGEGQSLLELVRVPVTRLMSSAAVGRMHAAQIAAHVAAGDGGESLAGFEAAAGLWNSAADSGPQLVVEKAQGAQKAGFDLQGNPYNQTSPGILVQFAVFSLVTSATILVQERKDRTLERMLTTSLNRGAIIAGHLLAMFTIIFLQQLVLVLFGQFFLKVNYLAAPLATLLVMLAVALWSASLGLMIGVFSRSDQQVILYSVIAMFLFSALGGAWFPLEGVGQTFGAIARLTPGAWAMTGFQNILIRGLGLSSVLLPVAVLLGYAAGFFALGVWRFRN